MSGGQQAGRQHIVNTNVLTQERCLYLSFFVRYIHSEYVKDVERESFIPVYTVTAAVRGSNTKTPTICKKEEEE